MESKIRGSAHSIFKRMIELNDTNIIGINSGLRLFNRRFLMLDEYNIRKNKKSKTKANGK